jgi:hypothetical protein
VRQKLTFAYVKGDKSLPLTQMDFKYGEFAGRLVLNPQDFILRFEHLQNGRLFEQTFFDRDFVGYTALGGLEFAEKLLESGFCRKDLSPCGGEQVSVTQFVPTPTKISFNLVATSRFLAAPLTLSFSVPAVKKSSGGADTETLARRLKELSEAFEKTLEERLAAVESLKEKVAMLEERCGGCVLLPGCLNPIPVTSTEVLLIKGNSHLPSGAAFSSFFPKTQFNYGNQTAPFTTPYSLLQSCGPTVNQNAYIFESLPSINSLRELKNLRTLTLSGASEITDYSSLGSLTSLTSLTIVSSRYWNGSSWAEAPPPPGIRERPIPKLSNISWIRELKKLTHLSFLGCANLVDISPLKDLPNLVELDIRETGVRNTECLTNPKIKITK